MKLSRWAALLEDEEFRRWYENLARGSEGTAKERAKVLFRFLGFHGLTPRGLTELGRSDRRRVEDMLSDFVGRLESEGKAPGYVENYLKAVRSWLDQNEVSLVRRIRLRNRGATPTLVKEERVPTRDELKVFCTMRVRG